MIKTAPCDETVIPNYPKTAFGRSRLARIHNGEGKAVYLSKHNTSYSRSLYHLWALVRVVEGKELTADEVKDELWDFQNRKRMKKHSQIAKAAGYVGVALLASMLTLTGSQLLQVGQRDDDIGPRFDAFASDLNEKLAPVVAAVEVKTDLSGNPKELDNREKLSQGHAQLSLAKKLRAARQAGRGTYSQGK